MRGKVAPSAVFVMMVADPLLVDGTSGKVLKKPHHRSYFNVLVDGYQRGKFTIFAQSVAV